MQLKVLAPFTQLDRFKKKHTGTIGTIGCLSFNGNKIITTGGGGMILTNNRKNCKKSKILNDPSKR